MCHPTINPPQNPPLSLGLSPENGIKTKMGVLFGGHNSLQLINLQHHQRPLKAISHYWRMKIAEYQSRLNKYGLKTSRGLRLMYSRWRRQVRSYIDAKVRQTMEWFHSIGVSTIKIGYPKYIAQRNDNFDNIHAWTYGYLLSRIFEIAEEYGINVIYVNEAYTSSRCPIHGD
jgi:putative transposase